MRKLKVYGIAALTRHRCGQWRYVCACSSLKEFAKILGSTYYYVRYYASVTANEVELKIALANPNKLIAMRPSTDYAYDPDKHGKDQVIR